MRSGFLRRLGPRLREPFPVVLGNTLASFEQGPDFYRRMADAIDSAEATVDVEQYLWDDDAVGRRFVDTLRAAAERGLRVRVLVDAVGANDVVDPLDAVVAAGGDVRVFNPIRIRFLRGWFHRTHKKLLLTDGRRAFTGGAGFSQHWTVGTRREQPWHDRMYEVRGPVVEQLERAFATGFARFEGRGGAARRAEREDATRELSPPGPSHLRVLRGWPDARDFRHTLVAAVRAARQRVWLGTPYFIPPLSLFRALTVAVRRGVDVQLVLPSGNYAHPLIWHASRRHYGWFLRRGARIHEYTRGFYHAKLAVVDDTAAFFGSSNLDAWSWNRNAEVDLVATDAATVGQVARDFEADRACAAPVTLRAIGMRGAWNRVNERFAGWIEDWL